MRNILVHVPHKEKERFASLLKGIWLTTDLATAKQRAQELADQYKEKCPKAVETLEEGLEDALTFLAFPKLDARKVSSNNMLERLNKEIRRRTRVVGIFPNPESYLRLVTVYLMGYSEDWSVTRSYLSEESLKSLNNQAA
jgi:transposase-like protein